MVGSKISPVQQPVMIPPRQIEGNLIEEMSAEPIDMLAGNNDDPMNEGAAAKRKRRLILSVFGK